MDTAAQGTGNTADGRLPGDYSGTECWTDLFAIWLKKVFYRPGERF